MRRTHRCGEIRSSDIGKEVVLQGWAHGSRDHGGLMFIDLRDRTGLSQIVIEPSNKEAFELAKSVHYEWVLEAVGTVRRRPDVGGVSTINPNLPTGEVEVVVSKLVLHNKAKPLPFLIEEKKQSEAGEAGEEIRLRYRYLDLRRPEAQESLLKRSRAYQATRSYLHEQQFVEIETPYFVKYTPGGARNFLVPSRLHPGSFYALAESPQIFKQLSMVAGFDRYFQIARCFRDEDFRADRQPEFTQIDIEMSFVEENDVMTLVEGLLVRMWKDVLGVEVPRPFPRLAWEEAMERYGSDKPDLRFGLELATVTEAVKANEFPVFKQAIANGHVIKTLTIPAAMNAAMSRKDFDDVGAVAESAGSKVAWIRTSKDAWQGPAAKFFTDEAQKSALLSAAKAQPGDAIVFAANAFGAANAVLNVLRLHLARRFNLVDGVSSHVVTGAFKDRKLEPFATQIKEGKLVRAVTVKSGLARVLGDPAALVPPGIGASWLQTGADFNAWTGEHGKAFAKERALQESLLREAGATAGDLLVLLAGDEKTTAQGAERVVAAARAKANLPAEPWKFLWVYKFPLFERDDETGNLVAAHHPFTSPVIEDLPLLASDPAKVKARAYDVVLNGNEIGGGSIRIHRSEVQAQMFKALSISDEDAKQKFGFLLEAFEYGAPPHGGIALGMDRLSMLLAGAPNLREVLAFPKNQRGQDAMTGAPTPVSDKQLRDLSIKSTASADK